jgi:hypothetical protein
MADDPTPEATWLRQHWHSDDPVLSLYKNQWIAVKGDGVMAANSELDPLFTTTSSSNPLYAFVFFGDLQ